MGKKIIDIYHEESITTYDEVCKNTEFIIHKGTQGTSFVDKKCGQRIKAFEDRKHPYWIYTFLNKGNELEQTKFLVNTYKDIVGKYFIGYVLDIEQGNSPDNCLEALKYLLKQPYKVMIYCQYSSAEKYSKLIAKRSNQCAFWECRYGDEAGNKKGTDRSAKYPFHKYADLGQFTEFGKCGGVNGYVDLNKITGNGKGLEWFTTPLPTQSEPVKQNVKYFSPIKNKAITTISQFLHARGFGAGQPNLRKIAELNADSPEVKSALFQLAKKGLLKKPDGLNPWRIQ